MLNDELEILGVAGDLDGLVRSADARCRICSDESVNIRLLERYRHAHFWRQPLGSGHLGLVFSEVNREHVEMQYRKSRRVST